MLLKNGAYDILKYLTIIVLPAVGSLYAGLSKIWDLPYASQVPATITVICTFLGAILCISSAEYNKQNALISVMVDEVEDVNDTKSQSKS